MCVEFMRVKGNRGVGLMRPAGVSRSDVCSSWVFMAWVCVVAELGLY